MSSTHCFIYIVVHTQKLSLPEVCSLHHMLLIVVNSLDYSTVKLRYPDLDIRKTLIYRLNFVRISKQEMAAKQLLYKVRLRSGY